MKKLIQEINGKKRKFIVPEDMIKEGYFFGEQRDLMTFATNNDLVEFENQDKVKDFEEFIKIKGLEYCTIPCLVEENTVKTLSIHFPFYYQNYCNEIGNSSELFNNERCEYIEKGQVQISICSQEDVTFMKKEGNRKLYKSIEDNRIYLCSDDILEPVIEVREEIYNNIC